jgi:hypothetical protein
MKKIELVGSDGIDYTIYIASITCIFPSQKNTGGSFDEGTYIRLSCGHRIHVKTEISTLRKWIDEA